MQNSVSGDAPGTLTPGGLSGALGRLPGAATPAADPEPLLPVFLSFACTHELGLAQVSEFRIHEEA